MKLNSIGGAPFHPVRCRPLQGGDNKAASSQATILGLPKSEMSTLLPYRSLVACGRGLGSEHAIAVAGLALSEWSAALDASRRRGLLWTSRLAMQDKTSSPMMVSKALPGVELSLEEFRLFAHPSGRAFLVETLSTPNR